jgi:hypothetical protein
MWLRIFFTPVTPDCKKGDNKFTGKMNKVTIELKKMSAADEEAAKKAESEAVQFAVDQNKRSARNSGQTEAGRTLRPNATLKVCQQYRNLVNVGNLEARGTSPNCPNLDVHLIYVDFEHRFVRGIVSNANACAIFQGQSPLDPSQARPLAPRDARVDLNRLPPCPYAKQSGVRGHA